MKMLVYAWTVLIISFVSSKKKGFKTNKVMPSEKHMTCEEFGKNARFNPHSVVSDRWLIFYYYGPVMPPSVITFRVPSRREISYLHFLFDGHLNDDFDWKANMLLRFEESKNDTVLLVERNYKGSYWMYLPVANLQLGQMVPRFPLQLRQTHDNKYMGFMLCEDQTVYIMSRLNDVPPKAKIMEEAAKIGFVGKKGKSYLYQGSQWMPTGESDEESMWAAGFTPTERVKRAEQARNRNVTELPQ